MLTSKPILTAISEENSAPEDSMPQDNTGIIKQWFKIQLRGFRTKALGSYIHKMDCDLIAI